MTRPTDEQLAEDVEVDLRQALFTGLNLDQGDDACIDYVSDLVRLIRPILLAALRDARAETQRLAAANDGLRLNLNLLRESLGLDDPGTWNAKRMNQIAEQWEATVAERDAARRELADLRARIVADIEAHRAESGHADCPGCFGLVRAIGEET